MGQTVQLADTPPQRPLGAERTGRHKGRKREVIHASVAACEVGATVGVQVQQIVKQEQQEVYMQVQQILEEEQQQAQNVQQRLANVRATAGQRARSRWRRGNRMVSKLLRLCEICCCAFREINN
eukprot:51918-Chlamydomonas_euryale.AAC.1